MGTKFAKIVPGHFFHICNRAVGSEPLFLLPADYYSFLDRMGKFVIPAAELHAYCLMSNHYHLLVRVREEVKPEFFISQMNRLQSTYAKKFNFINERIGGLFIRPFKRVMIETEAHLITTFWYIHRNPLHHLITSDWESWPYSSYSHYLREEPGILTTNFFKDLFGGAEQIRQHHHLQADYFWREHRSLTLE
jgi:REP element-mobilizing transposase RayT